MTITTIEKLGNKCTDTICHKDCPVWWFNNKGAGRGCHNNCMETLRFPTVAEEVGKWLKGKDWSEAALTKFGGDYD